MHVKRLKLLTAAMGKLRALLAKQRLGRERTSEQKVEMGLTGKMTKRAEGTKSTASSKPSCAASHTNDRLQTPLSAASAGSSRRSPPFSLPSIITRARVRPSRRSAPVSSVTPLPSCNPTPAAATSRTHEQSKTSAHHPTLPSSGVIISEHVVAEDDIPLGLLFAVQPPASVQWQDTPVRTQPAFPSTPGVKATELSPISLFLSGSPMTGFTRCLDFSPQPRPGDGQDDANAKGEAALQAFPQQDPVHICSPFSRDAQLTWTIPWPFTGHASPNAAACFGAPAQAAGEGKGLQPVTNSSNSCTEEPPLDCFELPADLNWLSLPSASLCHL